MQDDAHEAVYEYFTPEAVQEIGNGLRELTQAETAAFRARATTATAPGGLRAAPWAIVDEMMPIGDDWFQLPPAPPPIGAEAPPPTVAGALRGLLHAVADADAGAVAAEQRARANAMLRDFQERLAARVNNANEARPF